MKIKYGTIFSMSHFSLKAIGKFEEALAITHNLDEERIEILKNLSKEYHSIGNISKAFEYYKSYVSEKDSNIVINNLENNLRESSLMAVDFEFKKELEMERLEKEKQVAVAEVDRRKQQIIIWSVTGGLLLVAVFSVFMFNRWRVTQKQKKIIMAQKHEVDEQKKIVEQKNKDITDSINYAERIQHAILPSEEGIKKAFPESFIFFRPRDIVSGDFYYFSKVTGDKGQVTSEIQSLSPATRPLSHYILAAADCTGHGVPGAFMSMICTALLNEVVNEKKILQPGEILNEVRRGVIRSLSQTGATGEQKDGMDIALCALELPSPNGEGAGVRLQYAGANNSLYLLRKNSLSPSGREGEGLLEEIDPDNMPVSISDRTDEFKNNTLELKKGDVFYLFTDGYADQFGGPKGKKFKYAQFKQLLLSVRDKPMDEQKLLIEKSLDEWKGTQDHVDDILVIGVRI